MELKAGLVEGVSGKRKAGKELKCGPKVARCSKPEMVLKEDCPSSNEHYQLELAGFEGDLKN